MKLSEACKILKDAGIDNPRHDAIEIFAELGGINRSDMLLFDSECENEGTVAAVYKRAAREPLQYVIGKAFFYNEAYEVNEDVLIPRSDTEILVEYACKNIPEGARLLDLCTGSGCIGISTVKNTKNTVATLADISEGALRVANKNAVLNGVSDRVELVRSDVMGECIGGEFFAILSNPPYVKSSVYGELEPEIFREPRIAFVGGEDGCDFYREITKKYKDKIADNGFIAYEIGYDQAESLLKIAEGEGMACRIIKDYSGNDRVAVLTNK